MPGYEHNPRIVDIERSLPGLVSLADKAGLTGELRSLVEMMDRRDRDIEQRHLNPPSIRVFSSVPQTLLATPTNTFITFDSIRWDSTNGGIWKASDPTKFYAPIDGVYAVGAHFRTDSLGALASIHGTAWGSARFYAANDAYNPKRYLPVSTEVSMRAGDHVLFKILNTEATPRTLFSDSAYSPEAYMTWLRPGVDMLR